MGKPSARRLPVSPEVAEMEPPGGPVRRRRRFLWWMMGAVVLIGGAVGVTLVTAERLSRSDEIVKLEGPARIFSLEDVRPGFPPVRLLDHQGTPVVLNFFGSWCPPCLREMPDLQAVAERYEGRLAVIGVTFQDTREAAAAVLERTGVTYPAGFDPDNRVALAYGLYRMPTTVFIAPDGRLLEMAISELTERQLIAVIERLYGL